MLAPRKSRSLKCGTGRLAPEPAHVVDALADLALDLGDRPAVEEIGLPQGGVTRSPLRVLDGRHQYASALSIEKL
jgi:hypothetical protein